MVERDGLIIDFENSRVPWLAQCWLVKDQCCHCCGTVLIPGLGASVCCRCGQNKNNNNNSFFWGGRAHMWHMKVPRLGAKLELQLPATATTTQDLSIICNLHHSSGQHQILNPLNKARDQTHILMDTSSVHYY